MLARRHMLGSTGLAGLFGVVWPASGDTVGGQSTPSDRAIADIATAINDFRKGILSDRTFPELAAVREQQRNFLRATGKFPDYLEVGLDVWQGIYDWHIRWQQPITMARDGNGRYMMQLVSTMIVLRHDTSPSYVGTPYDSK